MILFLKICIHIYKFIHIDKKSGKTETAIVIVLSVGGEISNY